MSLNHKQLQQQLIARGVLDPSEVGTSRCDVRSPAPPAEGGMGAGSAHSPVASCMNDSDAALPATPELPTNPALDGRVPAHGQGLPSPGAPASAPDSSASVSAKAGRSPASAASCSKSESDSGSGSGSEPSRPSRSSVKSDSASAPAPEALLRLAEISNFIREIRELNTRLVCHVDGLLSRPHDAELLADQLLALKREVNLLSDYTYTTWLRVQCASFRASQRESLIKS